MLQIVCNSVYAYSHRTYAINYAHIYVVNDFRLNSVKRLGNIKNPGEVVEEKMILEMCVCEIRNKGTVESRKCLIVIRLL